MTKSIDWYADPDTGEMFGEDGAVCVAEVRFAKEGEAEGSLGAMARFMAEAHGVTDLPLKSPAGWYYVATLEARGVWCRPVGPFDRAEVAALACGEAYAITTQDSA